MLYIIIGEKVMNRKIIALIVSGLLLLQGCATPRAGGGKTSSGGDVEQACNPLVIGAIAFAGCALISNGNKRAVTGAACAAAAMVGCYMVNSYKAQQTRTAQQVEDDYLRHNKQLPEKAALASYETKITPPAGVQRGADVQVASNIVVIPGRQDKNIKVEEKLDVIDSRGDEWGTLKKVANESGQAGEFQSSFKFRVQDAMSQGVYTVRRTVYLNNVAVRSDNGAKFQVVQGTAGMAVALLSE
ncbi:MAG: hypothetical protein COZ23_05800 [Hydrogenophilales bacterium CG_4_10_14_3_um_filter_58_23]|nr:MAG: hypothetical protein COW70_04940 [Hydrogenophilales bacterium CG18_big_fil_WC_8_21_14_2_50_58_12]PIY00943.1 MAG: hypothetical protein COZ23_05800 [Hydrogenophilales bacterium CG_4_10_14_3_um_filter_58_23]